MIRFTIVLILASLTGCASRPMTREDRDALESTAYNVNAWQQRQPATSYQQPKRTICNTIRLGYTYQTVCKEQ